MKNFSILLIITFLLLNNVVNSQASKESDTKLNIEKAHYLNGDLTKLLQQKLTYPSDALRNKIQGDVILSLIIDKTGKMHNLSIVVSANKILSTSSIIALNYLKNEWSPYKVNGKPIDKKYFIVFRYRMNIDSEAPEYTKRAKRFAKKQKYDKSLKFYDKAIKENHYDYKLYELRSKIKSNLGDVEGAKTDSLESIRIQNEIISCVDLTALGVTILRKRVVRTTRY